MASVACSLPKPDRYCSGAVAAALVAAGAEAAAVMAVLPFQFRHCEERSDEAIQEFRDTAPVTRLLDCFASLAMTIRIYSLPARRATHALALHRAEQRGQHEQGADQR